MFSLGQVVKPEQLKDDVKLGDGAYGAVWRVKTRDSQLLLAKRLRTDEKGRRRLRELLADMKLTAKCKHENVVQLVGASWTSDADFQALFEWVERGDLRSYLTSSATSGWNAEKLRIAVGIADALASLHTQHPPVALQTLNSSNVLLSAKMQAKLSGLRAAQSARLRGRDKLVDGVSAQRWMAPEVLAGHGDCDQAVDVFSLGVLLAELDTHTLPYAEVQDANGNALTEDEIVLRVQVGAMRPRFEESCPPELRELAESCLALYASDRPTVVEVLEKLRAIQQTMGW